VRAVHSVLAEAHGDHEPGRLDSLSADQFRELHGLVGEDFDPATVRKTYA
jgi:hypothetical protein